MPDILIRGMEMPSKGCLRCPFNLYYANAVYCNCMIIKLLGKPSEAKYQNEVSCPLHELPPHGDLISKDDAMNAILGDPPEAHYPSWYAKIVNEIPAIVPSNKEETEQGRIEHHDEV